MKRQRSWQWLGMMKENSCYLDLPKLLNFARIIKLSQLPACRFLMVAARSWHHSLKLVCNRLSLRSERAEAPWSWHCDVELGKTTASLRTELVENLTWSSYRCIEMPPKLPQHYLNIISPWILYIMTDIYSQLCWILISWLDFMGIPKAWRTHSQ